MQIPPDHSARRVLSLVASGADSFLGDQPEESALFYLVKKGDVLLRDVEEAYGIYLVPEFRHVFNALVLARGSDELIANALELGPTVVGPYKRLFFDRAVFRHTPAMFAYIGELEFPEFDAENAARLREYYYVAARQGPEYLANRFRVGTRSDVDPRSVMRTALNDMFDRFLVHRGQQLNSEIAREALKWGQSAMDAAKLVIEKGSDTKHNAMEELRVALETRDHTKSPEQANIDPKEVMM